MTTTRTTAYTVTDTTNGPCLYATCDLDDATSYAQINADRDLAENLHSATPHYVITGWNEGSMKPGDGGIRTVAHIYGKVAPSCAWCQRSDPGTTI